ncbi:hypothetical protein [Bradyrhizobium sp. G127]|uniref:hypothetical protein n=1 Tax=Bradyrhizobium sp. G127 TaxID=2904800 RepID=UPI001F1ED43C|nr:hypothetical protein [Bradyrhizobium sp. G127]MCF2522362.1 hypothetical protein [Bradyrhizobium sp. G127]
MLAAIISSVGGAFINQFFDAAKDIFHDYQQGKITAEECKTRLLTSLLDSARAIEVSHSETLAKTYASFMQAVEKSRLLQVVWASVAISQLLVLLWHQVGIPAVVAMGWVQKYPTSGSTVEWAYLLLGGCIGLGPIVLRNGPGAGSVAEKLKSAVSK